MLSSSPLHQKAGNLISSKTSTFVALGDPLQDKDRKKSLPRQNGKRSKQRHKGIWFARLLMHDLQGPMHDVMLVCSRRRRQSCSPAASPHRPPALAACLFHLQLACSWNLIGTMIKARHNLLVARLEDRRPAYPTLPPLPSGRVPSSSTFVPHRRTRVCEMQERNLEYRTHLYWSPSYIIALPSLPARLPGRQPRPRSTLSPSAVSASPRSLVSLETRRQLMLARPTWDGIGSQPERCDGRACCWFQDLQGSPGGLKEEAGPFVTDPGNLAEHFAAMGGTTSLFHPGARCNLPGQSGRLNRDMDDHCFVRNAFPDMSALTLHGNSC